MHWMMKSIIRLSILSIITIVALSSCESDNGLANDSKLALSVGGGEERISTCTPDTIYQFDIISGSGYYEVKAKDDVNNVLDNEEIKLRGTHVSVLLKTPTTYVEVYDKKSKQILYLEIETTNSFISPSVEDCSWYINFGSYIKENLNWGTQPYTIEYIDGKENLDVIWNHNPLCIVVKGKVGGSHTHFIIHDNRGRKRNVTTLVSQGWVIKDDTLAVSTSLFHYLDFPIQCEENSSWEIDGISKELMSAETLVCNRDKYRNYEYLHVCLSPNRVDANFKGQLYIKLKKKNVTDRFDRRHIIVFLNIN
jgi:hypothetical protein